MAKRASSAKRPGPAISPISLAGGEQAAARQLEQRRRLGRDQQRELTLEFAPRAA
jgi:hypothetical protein